LTAYRQSCLAFSTIFGQSINHIIIIKLIDQSLIAREAA